MVSRKAVERALRAFDSRDDAVVLDLVTDSDLDPSSLFQGPRRLRFRRDETLLEVVAHDVDGVLQVLLRLTPHRRFEARATTRGRGLTVQNAARATSDAGGVARLVDLPHGITTLELRVPETGDKVRTAWVRL